MFNSDYDYKKATELARVNTYADVKSINGKLVVANLVLLALLGYLGFSYMQNEINGFSLVKSYKTNVLGVSQTVENNEYTDKELLKLLKVVDVENVKNTMKLVVNNTSIKSQTSYTDDISKEIEMQNNKNYHVIIVKRGDTLSSIAQKYYGDAQKISKIISYNKNLTDKSTKLYEGETINIPF